MDTSPRLDGYPNDWDELRRRVYRRDGLRCTNCGSSDVVLHAHHVVPLSRGGTNSLTNLTSLCDPCHTLVHPHMQEPQYAADWMRPGAVPPAKTGLPAFAENAGIFIGGTVLLIIIGGALGLTCRALGAGPDPCDSAPADVAGDCREYRDRDPRFDLNPEPPNQYD